MKVEADNPMASAMAGDRPPHASETGPGASAPELRRSGSVPTGATGGGELEVMRDVLDALPIGICWKSTNSLYLGCNQQFAQDAGFDSPADIVGRSDRDLLPAEQAKRQRESDRKILEGILPQFQAEELRHLEGGGAKTLKTTKLPLHGPDGGVTGVLVMHDDVTGLKRTEEASRLHEAALRAAHNMVMITDRDGRIVWTNPAFSRITGYGADEVFGRRPGFLKSGEHPPEYFRELWEVIARGDVWQGEFRNLRKDGVLLIEEATITPVKDSEGAITHFVAVKNDITARRAAEEDQVIKEMQLRQSQKLKAVGQLAAGIAHEINTPVQFVGDNTRFTQEAVTTLLGLVRQHREVLVAARENRLTAEKVQEAEQALAQSDLEFLEEQVPPALRESLDGLDRIAAIVRAMKEFSHPGADSKADMDLNKAVQSTVTVARNEWKYHADLELDLQTDLPWVRCFGGEINQVLLNLVINAAQAIEDAQPGGGQVRTKGTITISTRLIPGHVEICVKDTGCGIPAHAQARVFEPFYTTKEVGRGSGQGLTLAYAIVVGRHGGRLWFDTRPGEGTTFFVHLPLNQEVETTAMTACETGQDQ